MKVLLSAYACEPNTGSEPGIGWNWALESARLGNDVWVLTRANNRKNIENGLGELEPMANLHFIYYDPPGWARTLKRGQRGIHPYYLLWQWGAYRFAREVHAQLRFDRVHHITLSMIRQPSFMARLGVPFIFGPVGGGDRAPVRLRLGYGWRGQIIDGLRDISNLLVRFDPLMRRTFASAKQIVVTSEATKHLVPKRYQHKLRVHLSIGSEMPPEPRPVRERARRPFKVLYVGRFVYWKGMHLGIRAFARLAKTGRGSRFTLVGGGADEKRWRRLSEQLGISTQVDWVPWTDHQQLVSVYRNHDVLLFPSMHDSAGMVVLEAMSHGLPVVCLDLGGPAMLVDASCGRVIATNRRSRAEVVEALAGALTALAKDTALWQRLAAGALERAACLQWRHVVGEFERAY